MLKLSMREFLLYIIVIISLMALQCCTVAASPDACYLEFYCGFILALLTLVGTCGQNRVLKSSYLASKINNFEQK